MRRLIALWQELGSEHAAEFEMSLKDQIYDVLIGAFAVLVVLIDVVLLGIQGGWL